MRVSLIKKNRIQGLILPETVIGNYWITDIDENGNERNLINIEARDGKWILVSNNNTFCVQNNTHLAYAELKEYRFVQLRNVEYINGKRTDNNIYIYVSPSMEKYKYYDISGYDTIRIGKLSDCEIVYNNPSILDEVARIQISNDHYMLSSTGVTYINNKETLKNQEIFSGDVIFVMGLKLVLALKDDKKMLMINHPSTDVSIKFKEVEYKTIETKKEEVIDEEEVFMNLYSDADYYHKNPRFEQKIDDFEISIDSPPEPNNSKEVPLLLTLVPMIMMSLTSLFTGYLNILALGQRNASLATTLPSILLCISMLVSSVIWPIVTRAYNKHERKNNEEERKVKYSKYVEDKLNIINKEMSSQKVKLEDMYPSTEVCQNTILNKMTRLWERRISDKDFLTVNLGNGNRPMNITINWPEEKFSMAEDSLKKMVQGFIDKPKILENTPVELNLTMRNKVAVIGNNNLVSNYVKQLLLQIMAYQSYDDVRIIILTSPENENYWNFMKYVPYVWSNDKTIRYYADNADEYKEVFYSLESTLNQRLESKDKVFYSPHYLIITDKIKLIRNYDFIKKILENDNTGFSILALNEKITNLPEQFNTFVDIIDNRGKLVSTTANTKPIDFVYDETKVYDYESCARVLSNLPLDISTQKEMNLPNTIGFLEMYDVGKVEQLNAYNRWTNQNPILSLHAPIGVGANGEKIELDLHEKFHGPHGLIAGMTGSGKSELIITYILSMAINYHPEEVQFILIDYKGGGLAGAFSNSSYRLPHLVGTITNLDESEINRCLVSIESELKRRQIEFNKAREISGESTIDIYKYQKMYRDGIVKEPISHLFIISDEFAELKSERPEFMAQLIQTARIGRSLGVHLILATQKPSGIVDAQIWSNTRFRICLRVQEQGDSTEVIKRNDAAFLKQTGRFYLQVGQNEMFVLGQAAWAGGKYIPSNQINKNIDSSVNFVNNIGFTIKTDTASKKNIVVEAKGEELSNIVKYLESTAKEFKIEEHQLWLDRIPNTIYVDELKEKYKYTKETHQLKPIIGEYDDPTHQSKHLLTLPLSKGGNALIYGVAGSGKENFISTFIYSCMETYTPDEVNVYAIDCGAGTLRNFEKFPIVGDVISSDNREKIGNLFKLIHTLIEERKKLFLNYNGSIDTYLSQSGKVVPRVVVIINEYEGFRELYEEYEDVIVDITRDGYKYGIHFIISASTPNGIRFKLKQNFNLLYALNQNNNDDFNTILGNVNKQYPSKNYGRGIIKIDYVYEFQTAVITDKEKMMNTIMTKSNEYIKKYNKKARSVPILPNVISYKDISSSFGKSDNLILGIAKETLDICEYRYRKNQINLFLTQDLEDEYFIIKPIINELLCLSKEVTVLDADEFEIEDKYKKFTHYYENDYEEGINKLLEYAKSISEKYVKNNYNLSVIDKEKQKVLIIIGLSNMMQRLSSEGKRAFEELLDVTRETKIVNVLIFEGANGIKKYEMDSWFKNNVNSYEGIWVGNGFNEQYTLKALKRTQELKEDVKEGYGFVIRRGIPVLVKFIESFDIKLN